MGDLSVMDHASPEDYDDHVDSEGDYASDEGEVKQESSHTSPSAASASAAAGQPVNRNAHLQKRRRVTRACDECRRKKIKCDGKQPCTHCTVYSYDCTYNQPSNRRRNPAPQYVENLEHRVHRAESLLHILIPNLDLNDPGIDAAVAQGWIPNAPGRGAPIAPQDPARAQQQQQQQQQPLSQSLPQALQHPPQSNSESKPDTKIESMLRAVAQLDLDETGSWDYHGHSSGLSFVRRMREQLGDIMGPETQSTPFVKNRPLSQVVESPKALSLLDSPLASHDSSTSGHDLPPRAVARSHCSYAIEDAAALLRVVHKPSFWARFDRLYNIPYENYNNDDHKFLPLFYSAMALGQLFCKEEESKGGTETYENAIQEGVHYFKTARQLMDIVDCRDLMSIQAVLLMMLFLQSSAKLSQCFAYIGVALRSALRMGLHRSHGNRFNPLESEIRKRIFWIVQKMDIYVAAMLGLPQALSDDDVDQDFPLEVDDEYVTEEGILPMPEGQVSLMAAFNAHTRLVMILSKITRYIYPIKTQSQDDKSYSVPFSAIREIESDLEDWKTRLPAILNPCPAPERYTRVQQLLRLSYAHAQIMLYRPFLHFVASSKRTRPINQRAYACAASYVNVSRNIIHIQTHMKQRGLLNGAYWFTQYTAFFAILSLVYFAAENPNNSATEAVIRDAIEGKDTLASLARRSMAADRCAATLEGVFSRLPDWMRNGQANPVSQKKRQLDPNPDCNFSQQQVKLEHVNANASQPQIKLETGIPEPAMSGRANTFPMHGRSGPPMTGPAGPGENWSQSAASVGEPRTPTVGDFGMNGGMRFGNLSAPGSSGVQQPPSSMMPHEYPNPALLDISVMFPAADEPFDYPNQPLTTFENHQYFSKTNPYMNQQAYGVAGSTSPPNGPPGSAGSKEENMEAQLYALPPYIEQRAQPYMSQQQQGGLGFASPGVGDFGTNPQQQMISPTTTAPPTTTQMTNGGVWQTQQQPFPRQGVANNINLNEIFGGSEFNPVMMPGGYQPMQ